MFDTCHPQMKAVHIAAAAIDERPDAIALSFLSTTSYPAAKARAQALKRAVPKTPIITGGVFATMNATKVLPDCEFFDCVGVGEIRGLADAKATEIYASAFNQNSQANVAPRVPGRWDLPPERQRRPRFPRVPAFVSTRRSSTSPIVRSRLMPSPSGRSVWIR